MAAYQCPVHEAKSELGFTTCWDAEEVGSNASEVVDVASKSEGKKTESKTFLLPHSSGSLPVGCNHWKTHYF